jgi:hypothetical protein
MQIVKDCRSENIWKTDVIPDNQEEGKKEDFLIPEIANSTREKGRDALFKDSIGLETGARLGCILLQNREQTRLKIDNRANESCNRVKFH